MTKEELAAICPYCNEKLYQSDKNQDGKDVYECERDNRVWVVKTGEEVKKI